VKGFGNMISGAIREAGLPARCKAHGLRKAAARRSEAGCSASEIAAITGHKTLAEVERYTRAADQERLARQAIQRQSENKSGKPELDKVANNTRKLSKINSLIAKMALPRGVHEFSNINMLAKSGTVFNSMGSLCFLPRVSHQPRAEFADLGAPIAAKGQGRVTRRQTVGNEE
jgi:hypothetical protein